MICSVIKKKVLNRSLKTWLTSAKVYKIHAIKLKKLLYIANETINKIKSQSEHIVHLIRGHYLTIKGIQINNMKNYPI